jgi:hypothetical protein
VDNGACRRDAGRSRSRSDEGGVILKRAPTGWNQDDFDMVEDGVIVGQTQFLAGFTPPGYIVDGVLQRRFIYLLWHSHAPLVESTLRPHSANAWSQRARSSISSARTRATCARLIGANALRFDNSSTDRIYYVPGVFNIEQLRNRLISEAQQLGGIHLIIIDTSAAYFLGNDEVSNTQMGAHARMLRWLTMLPGGACVVPLCHPIKRASDQSHLLLRGGGAFLAEMDGWNGNLSADY